MLSKLLKYDFKSLSRALLPVYAISLLLALITRVSNMLAEKFSIFSVPNGFLSGAFVVTLIVIPIFTFIFTILRFYQNLVKDEGYLMHTIPVSKSNLILSKTISSSVYLILSVIMVILLVFIGVYGVWFDNKAIHTFINFLGYIDKTFLTLMILSIFIGVLFNQVMIYASISLGQKHNSKILYSIIYGVVLYNVTQIGSVILMLPFMLLDSNYQQYIQNSNISNFGLINGFLVFSLIISILFILAYYFLAVRMFNKKLNLQ